jgi:hypothetical protein
MPAFAHDRGMNIIAPAAPPPTAVSSIGLVALESLCSASVTALR